MRNKSKFNLLLLLFGIFFVIDNCIFSKFSFVVEGYCCSSKKSLSLLLPSASRPINPLSATAIVTTRQQQQQQTSSTTTTTAVTGRRYHDNNILVRYNFFKNLLDSAFENDRDLLTNTDKRKGMLEGPDDDISDDTLFVQAQSVRSQSSTTTTVDQLTNTQRAWRERQRLLQEVTENDIIDSIVSVDLYLTGVPNKDPSNDLYGGKTNISNRDRNVGLTIPSKPTIENFVIQFLSNYKCQILSDNDTGFGITSASIITNSDNNEEQELYTVGDWKLNDSSNDNKNSNGRQIRFRFGVNGYQRTVETKGTIQNVYWKANDNDEQSIRTTTKYQIPQGWLYGECIIRKKTSGPLTKLEYDIDTSILKIEQSTGFMGISSKMIPCGKFITTNIQQGGVI